LRPIFLVGGGIEPVRRRCHDGRSNDIEEEWRGS
jgi:hypothetical protein